MSHLIRQKATMSSKDTYYAITKYVHINGKYMHIYAKFLHIQTLSFPRKS